MGNDYEAIYRERAADYDALVTAELLGHLLDRARERGLRTLQDLDALQAATRAARRRKRGASPTAPRADSCPEGPA